MKIFFRKGGRGRGHPPVSPGGGRGGWPPACISAGPVPGGNTSSAAYLQNAPCQRAPTDRHLAGAPAAKLPPSHPPTFPVSADVMVPPARVDKCPRPPLFPVSPGRCGCPRPRLLVRRGEGRFPCTVPRRPALPVLPCALPHPHASHSLCTFPAPPRTPHAAFPGPRTDAFPATSPPSSGKFAKAVRPASHFLLLFLHFLPQFRRFGPRNPKKRQPFLCVYAV